MQRVSIGFRNLAWVSPINGHYRLQTVFSTSVRNDTGQINSSPRVITSPVIKLQVKFHIYFSSQVNTKEKEWEFVGETTTLFVLNSSLQICSKHQFLTRLKKEIHSINHPYEVLLRDCTIVYHISFYIVIGHSDLIYPI